MSNCWHIAASQDVPGWGRRRLWYFLGGYTGVGWGIVVNTGNTSGLDVHYTVVRIDNTIDEY